MPFVTFGEYLTMSRPEETWLIEDILPVSGLCNLYAKAKTGKSYAALGMCIAISQGQPDWLNFPVHRHGPVVYVQIDTPPGLWHEEYICRVAHLVPDQTTIKIADQEMVPFPFNILGDGGAWLKREIAALDPKPVLVVLDTIRDAHAGDENDSGHMRNVLVSLVDAVRPAALVIVSHSRKENIGIPEDVLNDNRGSNYIAGRMDSIVKLTTEKPSDNNGLLIYQSRTAGGRVQVIRDPDSGLWKAAMRPTDVVWEVVRSMPRASQNAQAEVVAAKLGISHRTAVRRIIETRGAH